MVGGEHDTDCLRQALRIDPAERESADCLSGIASRNDPLFACLEMMSHLPVGHVLSYGAYQPKMQDNKAGLLGEIYRMENGRHRNTRISGGGHWNPQVCTSPDQPGRKVRVNLCRRRRATSASPPA